MSAYGTTPEVGSSTSEEHGSPITTSSRAAMILGVAGVFGVAMVSLNNLAPTSVGLKGLAAPAADLSVANKLKPVEKPLYGDMSADDIEQLFGASTCAFPITITFTERKSHLTLATPNQNLSAARKAHL